MGYVLGVLYTFKEDQMFKKNTGYKETICPMIFIYVWIDNNFPRFVHIPFQFSVS